MSTIVNLQRIGWLVQGVAGAFASVASAGYGLWGTFASDSSVATRVAVGGAAALTLIPAYYFVTHGLKLNALSHSAAAMRLFLQAEYNWAIGCWCLLLTAFAFIANALS